MTWKGDYSMKNVGGASEIVLENLNCGENRPTSQEKKYGEL